MNTNPTNSCCSAKLQATYSGSLLSGRLSWCSAAFAARWLMGGIFIYAGLVKIGQPLAFARDIANYRMLPDAWVNPAALGLPWLELVVGLCLLAGVWLPGAVVALNSLLIAFLGALLISGLRGIDVQCGCFGSDPVASGSFIGYLLRDAAFLALGALLHRVAFRPLQRPAEDALAGAGFLRNGPAPAAGERPGPAEAGRMWQRAGRQAAAIVALSALAAGAVYGLRADRLPVFADGHRSGEAAPGGREGRELSLAEAEQLFAGGAAVFFDARPAREFARGRIRGARSLPWAEAADRLGPATADLDLETPIVTYCDGAACELSHHLARLLREAGFANVRVLVNGWGRWQPAGLPIESGQEGPAAAAP